MTIDSKQTTDWLDERVQAVQTSSQSRVVVFLRSLAPPVGAHEQQERVLDRLDELARRGVFESVTTTVWGKALCPDSRASETTVGRHLHRQVREFQRWQSDASQPIDLPFERREIDSTYTDEQYRAIRLPRLCFGVHVDDDLQLVVPCEVSGSPVGIDDFLEACRDQHPVEPTIGTSA
jgi:hypothetical protein